MIAITELNSLPTAEFTRQLSDIFEHSPWVASGAASQRPFHSVDDLHRAMVAVVEAAPVTDGLALLRAHPELAAGGKLTAASAAEQGGKGLDQLSGERLALLTARNTAYRERFGFPFIIAVRGQRDIDMIIEAVTRRLANQPDQEFTVALSEVAKIARFRLQDMVNEKNER